MPRHAERAEAAQCAHDQGRFWDYHDALFADPSRLQRESLIETARRLGLEMETFEACVTSHAHAADVSADVKVGEQAGVGGTPTVFVNGVGFVGALPLRDLRACRHRRIDTTPNRSSEPAPATRPVR